LLHLHYGPVLDSRIIQFGNSFLGSLFIGYFNKTKSAGLVHEPAHNNFRSGYFTIRALFKNHSLLLVNSSLLLDASPKRWPLLSPSDLSSFLSTGASLGKQMGYVQESSSSWLLTALC
jgi:hypothetical protein